MSIKRSTYLNAYKDLFNNNDAYYRIPRKKKKRVLKRINNGSIVLQIKYTEYFINFNKTIYDTQTTEKEEKVKL